MHDNSRTHSWSHRLNLAIIALKQARPEIGYKQIAAELNVEGWGVTKNQLRKRYRALNRAGHFTLGPQRQRRLDASVAADGIAARPAEAAGMITEQGAEHSAGPIPPLAGVASARPPKPAATPQKNVGSSAENQLPRPYTHLYLDLDLGGVVEDAPQTEVRAAVERAHRDLHDEEINRLRRRLKAAVRTRALDDRIVDVFRDTLRSLSVAPRVAAPHPVLEPPFLASAGRGGGGNTVAATAPAGAAVLLISDAHVGQVVDPAQVGGVGPGYGPQVYMERLAYLGREVFATLRQREATGSPVAELHVFILGDILHGCLNHGAEREETILLVHQMTLALYTLTSFLGTLAAAVPALIVHGADGNHARLPGMHRPPTVNRFSNFDQVLYQALEHALGLAGLANVRFRLGRDPIQLVIIQGVRFLARHGDTLRGGGDKLVGVPVAAIGRDVAATTLRYHGHGQPGPDYYLIGDKHRATSLSLPTGEFLVNGSFVGADEYSYSQGYPPARPVQVFFGVSPGRGKTWQEDVDLRFAPTLDRPPYVLPAHLLDALFGPAARPAR